MDTRNADENTQQRELIIKLLSRVNTSMPGIIESFDDATQTARVKPAITMKTVTEGVEGNLELPVIENAPCCFPFASTAGFALTLPIRAGDPCLIHYSKRAIDNWHENGGVQPPESGIGGVRAHSITDAIITFAPSDLKGTLGAWEADGIQLRNRDKATSLTIRDANAVLVSGTSVLTLDSSGVAALSATESITLTTPEATIDADTTTVTGDLVVEGEISAAGDISSTAGEVQDPNISLSTIRSIYNAHTHEDVHGLHTQPPDPPPM